MAMWKKTFIHILILFLIPFAGKTQVSHGGKPLPLTTLRGLSADFYITMPSFDIKEELRIDSMEQNGLRSGYRFAYKFMSDLTPDNSGTTFTLANGTRVWRLGIYSPGAYSINVLFSEYELPEGASLYLYNTDQSKVLGSFTHLNNSTLGKLPVSPVSGDRLIIEYQEPANASFHAKLKVGEINHAYRDFRGVEPGDNLNDYRCMDPVSCHQEEFGTIGRSVVLLAINGIYLCTGTLVNNTSGDGKPYLLTASHCLNNSFSWQNPDYNEIAGNIVCFFNYNSPLCETRIRGTEEMSMASAYSRAINEKTDMALLELIETPPVFYQPYYAGWNAADAGKPPYAGIHHPGGSVKRVNTLNGNIYLTTYYPSLFQSNSHWKINLWTTGSTHGGSSGSPLLDSNNRIIGALSGGGSTCARAADDFYYAISKSWNTPAEQDKQLKFWLNPSNDKDQLICDGVDPYASSSCIRLSNVEASGKRETVEATRPTGSDKEYLFGVNQLGTTEYAEAYQSKGQALLYGTYIVNPAVQNQNMEIEISVYNGENGPETLLHTETFHPTYMIYDKADDSFHEFTKPLTRDQESFTRFRQPVEVDGSFYIGYKIKNGGDSSFEAFNLPQGATTRNTAWLKYKNKWIEATAHPTQPFSTSLFIDPVIRYNTATSNEPIQQEQAIQIIVGQDRKTVSVLLPDNVKNATFSMLSIDGKILLEKKISGSQETISTGLKQAGVYLIRIVYNNKLYTQKMVF